MDELEKFYGHEIGKKAWYDKDGPPKAYVCRLRRMTYGCRN
jgi:hypothetical protein